MGDILKNSEELFSNMTDEEFEKLLDDMGINYTKVKPGEGGIIYKGKLYKTYKEYDEAVREDKKASGGSLWERIKDGNVKLKE